MRRVIPAIVLVVLAMAISVKPAQTFNPATHIYIADHVFANSVDKTNLFYGSIAPDLSQYTDDTKWAHNPFTDTHYRYIDLRSAAWGINQKSFAQGWLTHNEKWGADYYAHVYKGGYVINRAEALLGLGFQGLTLDFAHFAIEAAIDLLLKDDDPSLGVKLLEANLLRSPLDRELLTKVLVLRYRETDWVTLTSAELTFRSAVNQYATALALPKPLDKAALVALGVQLAQQQFGITTTVAELTQVLNASIALCEGTYYSAIWLAIHGISQSIPN